MCIFVYFALFFNIYLLFTKTEHLVYVMSKHSIASYCSYIKDAPVADRMLKEQEKLRKGSVAADVLENGKDGAKIEKGVDGMKDDNHNTDGKLLSLILNPCLRLETLNTIGNFQRPVFSLGVSQHMHTKTNL